MTLEFHKLTNQIEALSEYYSEQQSDYSEKLDIALSLIRAFGSEARLETIHTRVQGAIDRDLKYRGARPIDEPIFSTIPPASLPTSATIIGVDGSQITPNPHSALMYYLINTGAITIRHGSNLTPEINSQPGLYYDAAYINTSHGSISSEMVDLRRTSEELSTLAEISENNRDRERPLLSLVDGPLLYIMRENSREMKIERERYFKAMRRLKDIYAVLTGYVDRPRSSFVTAMLHLLDLDFEIITENLLRNNGRLEGLHDIQLFGQFLPAGHRSSLFTQISPMNKSFKELGGENFEIAFFYMNVSKQGELPVLSRVEIPLWVAENRSLVSEIQALLHHQCQQTGIRYPYALTRADELAVVKFEEARQLGSMIQVALNKQDIYKTPSHKQLGKESSRVKRSR